MGATRAVMGWPRWKLAGVVLAALHVPLLLVSFRFEHGALPAAAAIVGVVALQFAAGVFYLVSVWKPRDTGSSRASLAFVLVVGAVMRILLFPSAPMLENDYYRYLWDGGVVASGNNPYSYPPRALTSDAGTREDAPAVLEELATASGVVVTRVNHPGLRSIYPPVAQAAFAVAHTLRPWSLTAWRLVLVLADVTTAMLLWFLLRRLNLPVVALAIYWWNPLLVRETLSSSHLDVVALPFVVGAVLAASQRRVCWSSFLLALGTGVKLWPVLLLPILLRSSGARPRHVSAALAIFGLVGGAMAWPVLTAGLGEDSGFVAYGNRWEMNDGVFMILAEGMSQLVRIFHGAPSLGPVLARIAVSTVIALGIAWTAGRKIAHLRDRCRRCLAVLAALFLLSPTAFPWYAVWMLPFLATAPRLSLLLLTPLLPLYYLRFQFKAWGMVEVFDYGIVWAEFAPVWTALAVEWIIQRRRGKFAETWSANGREP